MAEIRNRARKWFGMRNYHFETHDANGVRVVQTTEAQWRANVINELMTNSKAKVNSVAFVFHDRDYDDHGNPKPLHVHLVVEFQDARERKSVAQDMCFKDPNNVRSDNLKRAVAVGSVYRYLTHTTDQAMKDGKVRYAVQELYVYIRDKKGVMTRLVGDALEEWYRKKIRTRAKEVGPKADMEGAWHDISEAIKRGKLIVSPDDVNEWLDARKELYGFDDVSVSTFERTRYKQLEEEARKARKVKANLKMAQGRKLRSVYISGLGGLGKSKLANDLAGELIRTLCGVKKREHYPRHIYTASVGGSGAFDPLGNYQDQEVTVMDDLNPLAFPSAEVFLKMFEPRLCPQVPSRNNDVYFLSEYVLVTKALNFEEWVKLLADKAREDKGMAEQIRRRFKMVIQLERDCIRVLKLKSEGAGRFVHKQEHLLDFPNEEYVALLEKQADDDLSRREGQRLRALEKARMKVLDLLVSLLK